MARVALAWDTSAIAAAKAALGIGLLAAGFVAISDDDFSRAVIAEKFVHAPALDPSGTSWLPLPFWLHGAAMAVFGRSLAVSHGTALLLGVASALFVHRAALWLGASRPGAALAALVSAGIPTAARLGVSSQPEALTAGLVVLGAATSVLGDSRRVIGAAALLAATLCRYEAWAAAAAFAGLSALDAARARSAGARTRNVLVSGFAPFRSGPEHAPSPRLLLLAALLPLCGPLAWVAHGTAFHGDALFFLHRVAAYRRALGATEPLSLSLIAYPAALFRAEPELALSAVFALRVSADRAPRELSALARPALVVASTFAFLVVGRILDGAPTHHGERTLLPSWILLAIVVGEVIARALTVTPGEPRGDRVARAAPLGFAIVAISWALRAGASVEPFAPRAPERAVGAAARKLLSKDDRLAVDARDFGYFAVIAAFGAPERTTVLDDHDPRRPRLADPFASETLLAARLERDEAAWLVAEGAHRGLAERIGTRAATAGDFALIHVEPR